MPELHISELQDQLTQHTARLEARRGVGMPIAVSRRFFEIGGLDLGGLLALELFTTVVPIMLIGWSYATDFSSKLSFGDSLIRQLDLSGERAELVRSAFTSGDELRSTWTVFGLASFLLWGIPMSAVVARLFATAWQRPRFAFWSGVWRGSFWFALFLGSQVATVSINAGPVHGPLDAIRKVLAFAPSFVFWAVTPAILVRDGGAGRRYLLWCGLAGTIIDTLLLRIATRIALPLLLGGWVPFGPIGVAMALMTWCTVVAACWVVTACVTAVVWERCAPTAVVIGAQRRATSAQ